MDNSKKEGGIVQLVVVLGLITFICALLLGVINGVTADKITQNGIETRNAAMAEIIPDADFEDLDTALSAEDVAAAGVTLPAGRTAAQIDGVYKATKDGEEIGYCVQVEPKGFGGNLTMIVGINADGTVAGAKVTSHAETPASVRRARLTRTGSPSLQVRLLTVSSRWPRTAARSMRSPALPSPPVL